MKREEIIAGILRVFLDFLAILLAWYLTYLIRPITDLIPGVYSFFPIEALPSLGFFVPFALKTALSLIFLFALLGFYRFQNKNDLIKEFFRILFGTFLWGMLIVSYFSLVRHETFFSRVMLAQALVFAVLLIFIFRLLLIFVLQKAWQNGVYGRRVALLGNGLIFKNLQKQIPKTAPFVLVSQSDNQIDELWYAADNFSAEEMSEARLFAEKNHLVFRFVPPDFASSFAKVDLALLNGLVILRPILSSLDGWGRVCKRFFDIVFSLLGLVLLSPLFLILAVLIKFGSRGPIFFVSERVGRKGRIFKMFKFRSMVVNADLQKKKLQSLSHRSDGPLFKIKNDPRITRVGQFLRRFSLDELPQLLNVLRGEMSLTGPRPYLPDEISKFSISEARILEVRPGITGLAQVSGRSDLSFSREIELNLYFIQNWSMLMDVKIILKTFFVMLHGKGAD